MYYRIFKLIYRILELWQKMKESEVCSASRNNSQSHTSHPKICCHDIIRKVFNQESNSAVLGLGFYLFLHYLNHQMCMLLLYTVKSPHTIDAQEHTQRTILFHIKMLFPVIFLQLLLSSNKDNGFHRFYKYNREIIVSIGCMIACPASC